eukprot:TRINITY_DN6912_c0_g1_i1.p1 TRINITY_DN6912_c0_g1~~TRINITY_DN6912_c0_g1_i1.p1  ORF type:complete len:100 (-),score=33.21 TRINITY_DN6912_c0_g1_i1:42-311(-)
MNESNEQFFLFSYPKDFDLNQLKGKKVKFSKSAEFGEIAATISTKEDKEVNFRVQTNDLIEMHSIIPSVDDEYVLGPKIEKVYNIAPSF